MITRGPIVRGQLYVVAGALAWVIQHNLRESYGSLSVGIGVIAIIGISVGTYILMDARSKRTPEDEANP